MGEETFRERWGLGIFEVIPEAMILDKIGRESVERRGPRADPVDGEWQKGADSAGEREAVTEAETQHHREAATRSNPYCNENFNL